MEKLKFKKILALILSMSITFTFNATIFADGLNDLETDTTTGWAFLSNKEHSGVKAYTYNYASSSVKDTYSSDVLSGISAWGTCISMSEKEKSPTGTFTVSNNPSSSSIAESKVTSNASTKHVISWTITINSAKYPDGTTAEDNKKKRMVIAHEIAHTYGLGHFSDTSKAMNPTYNSKMSVSDTDKAGIQTLTHEHKHDTKTSYTFKNYSNLRHTKRCNTCKTYVYENHNWDTSNMCKDCGVLKTTSAIYANEFFPNDGDGENLTLDPSEMIDLVLNAEED
ncbi:MAG: M10 family metallopeptidase domain-containing protein [Oscillospiraceae bacterium]|nr:M10 family metallopeptidase domain-containing protein [Oscillospiraceae bacterium]